MPRNKKAKLKTAIGVVVDESGSMEVRWDETIQAFNLYFDDIEETDPDSVVTVAKFSQRQGGNVRFLSKNEKVTDIPYLTKENYRPSGATPLYDAVGEVISKLESKKADRYLLVIITDGYENASKEHNQFSIQKKIQRLTATDKWTFVYLGADIDAWAQAQALGIQTRGTTFGYAGVPGATFDSVAMASSSTSKYLSSTNTSEDNFFKKEKEKTTS